MGWVLLVVGFLLIGPSGALRFPNQVWLIFIGFSFFGVAYASLIVTNIPLLQGYASEYDTVNGEYSRVTNYMSGFFNLAFGGGAFLGPLISPNIKKLFGYKGFTDLFAVLSIASLGIFIVCQLIPKSKTLKQHLVSSKPKEIGLNDQ
mmetsp:Transcript_5645/g.6378  ORF Transcript_5645/g.6378 Transcript_5645/m.6378 type:complete len:147 (-) Transcript_5645:103-543(-)